MLFPYIHDIIRSDAKRPCEQQNFSSVVQSAVICSNGKLSPNFEYITELRRRKTMSFPNSSEKIKNVLVLGK
jgi:alpha-aminoadipic semialdehyde synthase